ncbi:hypothetical protein [Isoptericola sp. NPDC057191]|uniref:hypothetical protein n=1 Tax=Isoptericola sp. NPDC057191 TaxID=3346041 RepID=UPI00362F5E27
MRIPGIAEGVETASSPWLTVGETYVVLGVIAGSGRRVELHLLTNDRASFGWFDAECFETDDAAPPANWSAIVSGGGVVEFGPKEWLLDGFWERYYDGDPTAAESVERELAIILQ